MIIRKSMPLVGMLFFNESAEAVTVSYKFLLVASKMLIKFNL